MAPENSGSRFLSRWKPSQPWSLALMAGLGGFAAASASLTVTGLTFTRATTTLVAVAALTSATTTFLAARASIKNKENQERLVASQEESIGLLKESLVKQQQLIDDLQRQIEEDEQLAIDFREQIRNAKADRSSTAGSLALLAAAFAVLLMAPMSDRERLLGQFQTQLVRVLGETLEGPRGIFLAPTRVVFLETTGDQFKLLRLGLGFWGCRTNVRWDIFMHSDDAKLARDVMSHLAPVKDGYLVTDVSLAREAGNPLYLRPPEDDVKSYCRVAVSTDEVSWGLLCVDTWSKEARLSRADAAVVSAFADMLGVALAAVGTDPKDS